MPFGNSNLMKYIRSLPLTRNMESFKKPLEYVHKKNSFVKERFNRLRAKLSAEVEKEHATSSQAADSSGSSVPATKKRGKIKIKSKKDLNCEPRSGGDRADSQKSSSKEGKKDLPLREPDQNEHLKRGRKRKFVFSDSDSSPTKSRPPRSPEAAPKQPTKTVQNTTKKGPSGHIRRSMTPQKTELGPVPTENYASSVPKKTATRSHRVETVIKPAKNCPGALGKPQDRPQITEIVPVPAKNCPSVQEKTPVRPLKAGTVPAPDKNSLSVRKKAENERAMPVTKKNAITNRMKTLRENLFKEKAPAPPKRKQKEKDCKEKPPLVTSVKGSLPAAPAGTSFTGQMENRLAFPFKIPKKPPSSGIALSVFSLPGHVAEERQLGEEAMDVDTESESSQTPAAFDAETVEEMDWEVNELRKEVEDSSQPTVLSGAIQKTSDSCWESLTKGGQWILVIDTNVFISALPFVQHARDTNVPGLGYPVIYVPHRVLCELDALKDDSRRGAKSPDVSRSARKAVAYLNSCLIERHPRVKGQTLKNYASMNVIQVIQDADDKILLSCLQVKGALPDKRVILVSNDVNLRNKSIVEDLETYSVKEFEKNVLSTSSDDNVKAMSQNLLEFRTATVIKAVLQQILEGEIGGARRETGDIVESFIQCWRSRFSHRLPVSAEEQLQRLREWLSFHNNGESGSLVRVIDCTKLFLSHFYVSVKPYYSNIKKTMSALEVLKTKALYLQGPPVEEKHYYGALEVIFRDSWLVLDREIVRIDSLTDGSQKTRIDSVLEVVQKIVDSLGGMVSLSILDVSSSPALSSLADALACCTNGDVQQYVQVLRMVATTVAGRELISKAEQVFRRALENITRGLRPSVDL